MEITIPKAVTLFDAALKLKLFNTAILLQKWPIQIGQNLLYIWMEEWNPWQIASIQSMAQFLPKFANPFFNSATDTIFLQFWRLA